MLLQSLKRAMPGVRALVIVDRRGHIVLSDDDLRDARLDDRQYTRQVASMRSPDTLYLSQPYENTSGAGHGLGHAHGNVSTGMPGNAVAPAPFVRSG